MEKKLGIRISLFRMAILLAWALTLIPKELQQAVLKKQLSLKSRENYMFNFNKKEVKID